MQVGEERNVENCRYDSFLKGLRIEFLFRGEDDDVSDDFVQILNHITLHTSELTFGVADWSSASRTDGKTLRVFPPILLLFTT